MHCYVLKFMSGNDRLSKKQFLALVDHELTRKTMHVTLQTILLYASIRFFRQCVAHNVKCFKDFISQQLLMTDQGL